MCHTHYTTSRIGPKETVVESTSSDSVRPLPSEWGMTKRVLTWMVLYYKNMKSGNPSVIGNWKVELVPPILGYGIGDWNGGIEFKKMVLCRAAYSNVCFTITMPTNAVTSAATTLYIMWHHDMTDDNSNRHHDELPKLRYHHTNTWKRRKQRYKPSSGP